MILSISFVVPSRGYAGASEVEQQKRVRELIYILRQHRVFARCDEWAGAIRELVQIGQPAVPELVAELDRTERNETLRALGFTLRAIDDKRAIPALIRAIPKMFTDGSDCGVFSRDPELNAFMRKHQWYPAKNQDESDKSFAYGRPVNEIRTALFKLTKHEEWPKENEEIVRVWREWWSKHGVEFVTPEELKSLELPKRDRDLVEVDGLARFGPLFPTGKDVILGPVYEVELTLEPYRNAPSYFDFDTGRMLQYFEGFRGSGETSGFGRRHADWIAETGVDVRCIDHLEGNDLHLWMIDNSRWETIEAEIDSSKPLDIGREERNGYLIPFSTGTGEFLTDKVGTFLFTTREGARGIVQVEPKEEFSAVRKMRYRLWNDKGDRAPHSTARTGKQDESQWEPVKELTLQGPGRGRAFLYDLETGKTVTPPDSEVPADAPLSFSFTNKNNSSFADWCRKQGIDLAAHEVRLYGANNSKIVKGDFSGTLRILNLVGLDLTDIRVTPDAFDHMTGEEARELATRWQANSRHAYLYMTFSLPLPPDTYLFVTNSGTIGLLQYRSVKTDLSAVTVRYKLLKKQSE